ncbi:putative quinol monooxygenase [Crossiella cryophila]|uniref:Quinol monooxygenase YgiN n=1 Tax=Crossiella cryophila TaxID=43355 RepID=A0A7W7FVN8_9PSEU|nr:putative quinol monooxygenase [Crossiella cryophila]MBB4678668.1 quinol monooxygenase YgiN [Crossiella cryophila]
MSDRVIALPEPDADETGPYAHLGFAKARPGSAERVEELILGLAGPLRAAPGAIEFHVHRDRQEPDLFVIYEVFRSREDLAEHLAQPHTQEFIQAIQPHVEGPLRQQFLRMCSTLPAQPVGRE